MTPVATPPSRTGSITTHSLSDDWGGGCGWGMGEGWAENADNLIEQQ